MKQERIEEKMQKIYDKVMKMEEEVMKSLKLIMEEGRELNIQVKELIKVQRKQN